MLQGIEIIFKDKEKMTASLKRETYKTYMEEFLSEHGRYFDEMRAYVEQAEDKRAAAEEIGESIAGAAIKTYAGRRGKVDARTGASLSLFMIYYVFPAILKQGESGIVIADGVLDQWRVRMHNKDIQYADYDTIYQGFRKKVLGIF